MPRRCKHGLATGDFTSECKRPVCNYCIPGNGLLPRLLVSRVFHAIVSTNGGKQWLPMAPHFSDRGGKPNRRLVWLACGASWPGSPRNATFYSYIA